MVGDINGIILQGKVSLRLALDDFADFEDGITEVDYLTAFPETGQYSDAAGDAELAGAPAGEFTNANGQKANPLTEIPFSLILTGLSKADHKALHDTYSGKECDVAVKTSTCGENNLGHGVVWRKHIIHVSDQFMLGGKMTNTLTGGRSVPACAALQATQRFNIIATV